MMLPLFGELKRLYICSGVGKGSTPLNAFDNALISAGVGNYNLLKVSSIVPPNVEIVNSIDLKPGSLLPIAYGYTISKDEGKVISSAVSIAIPKNRNNIGVIMEVSGYYSEEEIRKIAYNMALEAMKFRNLEIDFIEVKSACDIVKGYTCVFSGVAIF
ncbi:MAG: arginine decarboxylase, pyruvoyl-dependent [candidate division WOR-3 bacterium]